MTSKESISNDAFEEIGQKKSKERILVLHNDDYHTFDYVIEALIQICDHDLLQAEQCTQLIHFKGKCDVKKGSFSYLRPMKNALVKKDLKATID
jgi:ATP-dependent Clp protease adaptor protein ClpS